ncbi:hypothetical protein O0Q50_21375 [Priestia aryabhattai]|uniref:Uncharacterized protein n=1 Tax=Priestia aryabhattai TaxID=412384 RepID=A0AAX6NCU6_PRIAR|nr:hypothetical protein [Priestia aryabhattai]MDU9693731.1 hypothetical protein [Priestia aryabhattai]
MIGIKLLLLASIQVRGRVSISKSFVNYSELCIATKEFLESEGIGYTVKETKEKTIITQL